MIIAQCTTWSIARAVDWQVGRVLEDCIVIALKKVRLDGLKGCREGWQSESFLTGLLDHVQDMLVGASSKDLLYVNNRRRLLHMTKSSRKTGGGTSSSGRSGLDDR